MRRLESNLRLFVHKLKTNPDAFLGLEQFVYREGIEVHGNVRKLEIDSSGQILHIEMEKSWRSGPRQSGPVQIGEHKLDFPMSDALVLSVSSEGDKLRFRVFSDECMLTMRMRNG